jgi:hypothetical protein
MAECAAAVRPSDDRGSDGRTIFGPDGTRRATIFKVVETAAPADPMHP